MEDKHFEPVTARSLARDFYSKAMAIYHSGVNFDRGMNMLLEIIEPHIRKPSDGMMADVGWVTGGMKSVPQRCEEAYNEIVDILKRLSHQYTPTWHDWRDFKEEIDNYLQKPNPFKEADIVKEDDPEPTLLPFDLGLAARGHKVVTKDLIEVKIVAEGLSGDWPILAVYTDRYGAKQFDEFDLKGQRKDIIDDSLNLFILKEPETVDINIYREVSTNDIFTLVDEEAPDSDEYTLIKTITVTI